MAILALHLASISPKFHGERQNFVKEVNGRGQYKRELYAILYMPGSDVTRII